jgi:AcrR family transcriptional regulator
MTADISSVTVASRSKIPPRERILNAARELFYSKGIRAVSVDAIAEAADTNKMTLYRHFESKDVLVAEYLKAIAVEFEALWHEMAKTHEGDPAGQLNAWIEFGAAEHSAADDRGCPFANAAVEIPEKDHPAKPVIERVKTQHREAVADLCRRAGYRDPEQFAEQIVLLFEGACIERQCAGASASPSRAFDMIRSIVANQPKL